MLRDTGKYELILEMPKINEKCELKNNAKLGLSVEGKRISK